MFHISLYKNTFHLFTSTCTSAVFFSNVFLLKFWYKISFIVYFVTGTITTYTCTLYIHTYHIYKKQWFNNCLFTKIGLRFAQKLITKLYIPRLLYYLYSQCKWKCSIFLVSTCIPNGIGNYRTISLSSVLLLSLIKHFRYTGTCLRKWPIPLCLDYLKMYVDVIVSLTESHFA